MAPKLIVQFALAWTWVHGGSGELTLRFCRRTSMCTQEHRNSTSAKLQRGNSRAGAGNRVRADRCYAATSAGANLHRNPQLLRRRDGAYPYPGVTLDGAGNVYGKPMKAASVTAIRTSNLRHERHSLRHDRRGRHFRRGHCLQPETFRRSAKPQSAPGWKPCSIFHGRC